MRVSPCTSGIASPSSSTKHQDHVSPGSSEWMSGWAAAARVSAGVTVGRVVATADLSALQADAQMQPLASGGQALLAALDRLGQPGDPDVIEMDARSHSDQA